MEEGATEAPAEEPTESLEEAVSREEVTDAERGIEYNPETEYQLNSKEEYKKSDSTQKKSSSSKSKNSQKSDLESKVSEEVEKYQNSEFREEKVDTLDGSVVIIYYIDKATGKVYFGFEVKTGTYPIKEAINKLALLGGTVRLGESYPETLSRELKEEDPDSYKILIKALKDNGRKFDEVKEYIDGIASWTSMYAAEIKEPEEWKRFESTNLTEGYKRILSLEETIAAIRSKAFAFPSQREVIKDFIETNFIYPKYNYQSSNLKKAA